VLKARQWVLKRITQVPDVHLEQDIIVITRDQEQKQDIGVVENG